MSLKSLYVLSFLLQYYLEVLGSGLNSLKNEDKNYQYSMNPETSKTQSKLFNP